jgi:glycosyltransferase involved in cell wall biosynthesis
MERTAIIYYGGFLSRKGGAFFHARNLQLELVRLGWHVEIITLDNLPIWCRFMPHLVEKIVNFFYAPMGFLIKAYSTKKMYKFFFSRKAELLVFEDIYLAWNASYPAITMLHAVWSDNLQAYSIQEKRLSKFRKSESRLINKISHPIATVSYPYREYICNEHFSEAITKKIDVIELGIDQSTLVNLSPVSRSQKSIVYCGSLEARKNLFFLLNILEKLIVIDAQYSLTIIGDGPENTTLMKYVKEKKLPVIFLGRLANEDALAELNMHEIYVHTSVKESFSYSLLEAKMAGLVTCAYAKLQIPAVFIDVAIDSFCVDDWCHKILNINSQISDFDGTKFTAARMTQTTLNLVSNWEK